MGAHLSRTVAEGLAFMQIVDGKPVFLHQPPRPGVLAHAAQSSAAGYFIDGAGERGFHSIHQAILQVCVCPNMPSYPPPTTWDGPETLTQLWRVI